MRFFLLSNSITKPYNSLNLPLLFQSQLLPAQKKENLALMFYCRFLR